ncbi:hypothetical protein GALL_145710 [mine drainage metagenome]|uniref:Prepilin-type N-terminal cleavage/methylation domain-containing protein n=1 Tax=mine drainage metagenome TaxID=410659 RepID=A0A1J5S5U6_9ZZZZ
MQRINQLGFTLFELAIATATIYLLASFMVMIGREITINTKVNRLDRDLNSIRTAIYYAQDRLSPTTRGNFRQSSSYMPDSTGLEDNNNLNAIIHGDWRSTSSSNVYAPLRIFGGMIGVPDDSNPPIAGINGNYIICTNSIAGALVKRLDFIMDDGNTDSGTMVSSNKIGGTGIATDDISNDAAYVICLGV